MSQPDEIAGSFVFGPADATPQQYLAGALLLPAIIGMALLIFGLLAGRHTVLADATGLDMRSGRSIETLQWRDVAHVVAHLSRSKVTGYEVVGEEDDITIEWSAQVRAVPMKTGQALRAGELAALVEQRSGKRLETRK